MKVSPLSMGSNVSFNRIKYHRSDDCSEKDFKQAKNDIKCFLNNVPGYVLSNTGKVFAWADTPCSGYDIDVFIQDKSSAQVVMPKLSIREKIFDTSERMSFIVEQSIAKNDNWSIQLNPSSLGYSELYQRNIFKNILNESGDIKLDQETKAYLSRSL